MHRILKASLLQFILQGRGLRWPRFLRRESAFISALFAGEHVRVIVNLSSAANCGSGSGSSDNNKLKSVDGLIEK